MFSVYDPDPGTLMGNMTISYHTPLQYFTLRPFIVYGGTRPQLPVITCFYKTNCSFTLFFRISLGVLNPLTISVPTQATITLLCTQQHALGWLKRYLLSKKQTLFYSTYSYDTTLLSQINNICFPSTKLTLQPFETKCINYFQLLHELIH